MSKLERYDSLDGLRAFSAIGILIMHVYANAAYTQQDWIYRGIIPKLNLLVYLFMVLSAFSMCCGYFERFQNNQINLTQFYSRRYSRILPTFAILVVIDLIISPSFNSLIEGFADVTLTFGLLPNNSIEVIGVGWFLGVVFIFYMLFPFFCFLLHKKSFAWLSLVVAILLNVSCIIYFMDSDHVVDNFVNKHNFLFCAIFFVAGGLIYLYRDRIKKFVGRFRWLFLAFCVVLTALLFVLLRFTDENENFRFLNHIYYLVLFSAYTCYAISADGFILNNKVVKFISDNSMEIYLSHMVFFRVFEKLNLLYIFGKGWISYIVVCIGVTALSVVFSLCAKWFIKQCSKGIQSIKARKAS